MADVDPYEVLGISKDASDAEVKRAYRRLARQHHPDRNDDPAAEEKFKRIQSAYDAVGSPEARQKHDQEAQMRNMFGGGNPFAGGNPFEGGNVRFDFGGGGGGGGMEDILSQLFGGGAGAGTGGHSHDPFVGSARGGGPSQGQKGRQAQTGADLETYLDISIQQAEKGGAFPFAVRRLQRDGSGGVHSKQKKLNVKVKAGVQPGSIMRLAGMGHEHPHGEAGDLRLSIRIDPGEGRRWEGNTLVQEVPIPYSTFILGGKVRIVTPSGKTGNLSVAPESRIGDRRRMKGMGYAGGNLDLEYILAESGELSAEQLAAVEAMRELGL